MQRFDTLMRDSSIFPKKRGCEILHRVEKSKLFQPVGLNQFRYSSWTGRFGEEIDIPLRNSFLFLFIFWKVNWTIEQWRFQFCGRWKHDHRPTPNRSNSILISRPVPWNPGSCEWIRCRGLELHPVITKDNLRDPHLPHWSLGIHVCTQWCPREIRQQCVASWEDSLNCPWMSWRLRPRCFLYTHTSPLQEVPSFDSSAARTTKRLWQKSVLPTNLLNDWTRSCMF